MSDSIFSMFATSSDLEKEGVWLDYGNGAQIKLARAGGANEKFRQALTARMKPHRRLLDADQMPEALASQIMQEVYARTVVLDWRGVKDLNGTDLPYSYENVIKAFEAFPDFYQDIVTQAQKLSLYRRAEEEQAAGN